MRFEVLGPVQVHHDGRSIVITSRLESRLLAILLVRPATPADPAELIDAVWGSATTQDPNRDLRVTVSRLRGRLDSRERIQLRPGGYALRVEPGELDAADFTDLVQRARTSHHQGDLDATGQLLGRALKLWRGVPYTGLADCLSPTATIYLSLTDTVRRFTDLYLEALERLADIDLDRGEHERLITDLPQVVAEHPYHERFAAQLMTALDRAGRRAEALVHYETIRARLSDELGVDPGPELQHLYAALLAGGEESAPVRVVAQQLPSDTHRFTGRADALAELDRLVPSGEEAARPIVIAAVHGAGGIGKTALAVHWAHRVRDRFPDGQLFINLRGYGQGEPMTPAGALDMMLRSLDVPGPQIPADLDTRGALFRSLLADRRMLIVLDNARDAGQVRPLLPGSSSLVVVTSRDQLRSLEIRDGAHRLTLDPLQPAESIVLLKRVLPSGLRVYAESALAELAEVCGHLPLALRIAAEHAARHSDLGSDELSGLLDGLRQQRPGSRLKLLDVLDSEDPSASVRAVFSGSYWTLDPESARMFRLLGAHPGPGLSLPAAAALVGRTRPAARRLLDRLIDAHLVETCRQHRYEQHDLIRTYAAELADAVDPLIDRDAALLRVYGFYAHSAYNAVKALGRSEPLTPLKPIPDDVVPLEFADDRQALAWFDTMRETTVAAVQTAADRGLDRAACQLAEMMSMAFYWGSAYQELLRVKQISVACARRSGDVLAEADATLGIGSAHWNLGNYAQAIEHDERALELFDQVGSIRGQADALEHLGKDYLRLDRPAEAVDQLTRSVELGRRCSDHPTEPRKLHNLAVAYTDLCQYDDAIVAAQHALDLSHGTNRVLESYAWANLGRARRELGQHAEAASAYQRSLDLCRELGYRWREPVVLTDLARVQRTVGRTADARRNAELALQILDELGADMMTNTDVNRATIADLLTSLEVDPGTVDPADQQRDQQRTDTVEPDPQWDRHQLARSIRHQRRRANPRLAGDAPRNSANGKP